MPWEGSPCKSTKINITSTAQSCLQESMFYPIICNAGCNWRDLVSVGILNILSEEVKFEWAFCIQEDIIFISNIVPNEVKFE